MQLFINVKFRDYRALESNTNVAAADIQMVESRSE